MKTYRIRIPPDNKKKEVAFIQLLQNLHDTLGKNRVSFEILTRARHTSFCFACEADVSTLVIGQLYSMFSHAEIEEIPDPASGQYFLGSAIKLQKTDLFPIKTFDHFEGDSLSSILSVLQKADTESVLLQIVIQPRADSGMLHLSRRFQRTFENIRHIFRFKYWFKKGNFRRQFQEEFEKKDSFPLFDTSIRLGIFSRSSESAFPLYNSITNALSQYNTDDFNSLTYKAGTSDTLRNRIQNRALTAPYLMSSPEIASLFHLPNEREVPNLVYVLSKKSDPPATLPTDQKNEEISFFGETNFHNLHVPFGMLRSDRRRHLYLVGKSGSGKSKLLELLIRNDLNHGKGIGVLDPHGDLVDNVLRMIPKNRIKDVVVFDPADEDFPIAFNPLEKVPSALKMRVTIGFLEIFKKLFGTNWNERLEHVLRYTVLALLDSPNTTVLSILKMLTDKNYRQYIIRNIEDDVVKNFWVNEFAAWSQKFDSEAITPLLNKVGQFVATNMVRNIVGQPDNLLDFRKIMDEGKILLMKVSKGILGEENAGLMGAFAVTKLYQAAMSRADIPEEQRRDFYFYVDEFHNFATDTFDEILSEARKYRLALTLAHQFMGQLSPKIRKTIFGNVGSMISFRVGAEDAAILADEYAPIFNPRDIINLGVREFYTKLSIQNEITQAFSGRTINMGFPKESFVKECVEYSRKNYCHPVAEVKKQISKWEEGAADEPEGQPTKQNKAFEQPEFEAPLL